MGALRLIDRLEAEETAASAPLVAALDVGVSKTVCLAARRDPVLDMHPDRPLRVLGIGQQTAPAIASGKPADFEACARAIQVAIGDAAAMAGAPIKRVVASYSGPGVACRIVRASVRVRGLISGRDVANVLHGATQMCAAPQVSALHVEPLRYFIDEGEAIADPHGLPGKMLDVEAAIVTAPTEALNALRACVRAAGAEVEEIMSGAYAAALASLTPEERLEGAVLIDVGAGALGLSVFGDDSLMHAETMTSTGGVRLTRDLAAKLQTTFAAAERVKLHFGAVGNACDPREAVQAPKIGLDGRLEAATTLRGVIADTLTPRAFEMLLLVRQQLARAGFSGADAPRRAVLVGGGALIPGLRDIAVEALGMPVRLGRPAGLCGFDQSEASPAYAVAAGMLRWRLDNPWLEDVSEGFTPSLAQAAAAMRNAVHGMWAWLRENF